jgi:hypothetical protein
MRISLILFLLLSFGLQADIYRSVDKEGNVTYTDEPNNEAELVELEELPTYEAAPIPPSLFEETADTEGEEDDLLQMPNYTIAITSPEQNQSIWTGGGVLTASAVVRPELSSARGDLVQFTFDGNNVGVPQSSLSYTFENIERGSHILAVSVVDKNGRVIKTSKSILFQMHRNSIQGYGNAGG